MTVAAKRKPAPRTTAPRKAAKRVSTNGTNGAATTNGVAAAREPEEFIPIPPPEDPVPPEEFIPPTAPSAPEPPKSRWEHSYAHRNADGSAGDPYTDAELFVFTPIPGGPAGDAPIVFPRIDTIRPTYNFMWKLRKFDQVQMSLEWMDLARVPDRVQERVTLLPDIEQARFFEGWFAPAVSPQTQVGPPGES
jgi:hypothetical protein